MSMVATAVRRPVTVSMFVLAIMLFGMVGFSRLSVSLLPDLSYPTLTVRTEQAGAAPAEIEQLITKPIEEAVGIVKGIRKIHSISKAGQSDVVIEFDWGVEMNFAIQGVRDKLDIVQLPREVRKPVILRFNPSLDPIIRMGLSTTNKHPSALKELRTFAEQELKRQLESVSGVAAVQLGGGLQQEIQVVFDQKKAAQRGISAQDIVNRIQSENINMSAGRVFDGQQEYLVRTLNQYQSLEQMGNTIIKQDATSTIYLKDIATIIDGAKERTDITRINGNEAIELAIYKEGDANTVTVANSVNKRIEELKESLSEQSELITIYDQSSFIVEAVEEVKSAAIYGGILAIIVLYLFLGNFYNTFIISLAIPVSIIATFNLMFANNISLNIMSLGGIALAVGLLVDNAIVVLENIARYKEKDWEIAKAATKGTEEVFGAVVASTLTTLAVFFPLAFVEGFAGQLFSDQALTVTFALLASLFVAVTLIPMLSSRQKAAQDTEAKLIPEEQVKKSTDRRAKLRKLVKVLTFPFRLVFKIIPALAIRLVVILAYFIRRVFEIVLSPVHRKFKLLFDGFASVYSKILNLALKQRLVVVIFTGIFAAIVTTATLNVGMELIPEVSEPEFTVEITLPQGTPIQETDKRLQLLATLLAEDNRVKHSYSLAGTGSLMMSSASKGGENWGQLLVALHSANDVADIKALLRKEAQSLAAVKLEVKQSAVFTSERPLQIEFIGYDLQELKKYSDEFVRQLSQVDMFADVTNSLRAGQPELKISFDNERLSSLNLRAADIADQLVTKISGSVASKYNLNDRQIDILVRAEESERNSAQAIRQLTVNASQERGLPLASVAAISETIGPNEINRIDQRRVAIVSASLKGGDLQQAVSSANQVIEQLHLPFSIQVNVTGQSEEMKTSFDSLKLALVLAVFLVYLVMASQFESLLNPFIILFAVPLALLGAVLGLYLFNIKLSVIVFIGMIMLAGIVVNNAIVLIDRINQLRQSGVEKITAIKSASESRLRPIIMTTLTTVLGLLPLALASGEGSELRSPLAITVMSGLVVSTVLTLVVIPVLYSLLNRGDIKLKQTDDVNSIDSAEVS